jgi:hypothetical protein
MEWWSIGVMGIGRGAGDIDEFANAYGKMAEGKARQGQGFMN